MEEDGVVVAVTRELLCQPIIGGRKMVPMTGTMEVVGDMEDEVVEEMIGGGEEEEDPIQLRTGLSLYQGMIDLRKSCLDLAMGPLESISTGTSFKNFHEGFYFFLRRYEDIPVEATGTDVPKGIDSFDEVALTPIIKVGITY